MKKEIKRFCEVSVKGPKKYKPYVLEATDKFLEYMDCYYKLGFIKSVKLDVSYKENIVENE